MIDFLVKQAITKEERDLLNAKKVRSLVQTVSNIHSNSDNVSA